MKSIDQHVSSPTDITTSSYSHDSIDMSKAIIEEAEAIKKNADFKFAKNQLKEAVQTYTDSLSRLALLAGLPAGELLVIRCFSNQAQCFIKLKQFDEALASIRMALTVPSISQDSHMLSKLWIRKAISLQSKKKWEEALFCADKALALGLPSAQEYRKTRDLIISSIVTQGTIIAIPPEPEPMTSKEVSNVISKILQLKDDFTDILSMIEVLIRRRVWMDTADERKNNIMWAICQLAMMIAQKESSNPDVILPLLELVVIKGGAMSDQRFENIRNKTPLHLLAMAGAKRSVEFIIKQGASVHTLDDDGWSALVVACAPNGPRSGNNSDVVQLLIKLNSNINHKTKSGLSPIAAAAQSNDTFAVKVLLKAGADISQRCVLGFSPIVWAKIASNGKNNDSVSLLAEAVNKSSETIKHQMKQDICCVDTALILSILSDLKLKVEGESDDSPAAYVLTNALASSLTINITSPTTVINGHVYPTYEVLFSRIIDRFTPYILSKQWLPKLSETEFESALSCANSIEISWMRILNSNGRSDKDISGPELYTNDQLDCFVLSTYINYQKLIQQSVCDVYSMTVPSRNVLSEIAKVSKSLTLIKPRSHLIGPNDLKGSEYWTRILDLYDFRLIVKEFAIWEEDVVDVAILRLNNDNERSVVLDGDQQIDESSCYFLIIESIISQSLLSMNSNNRSKAIGSFVDTFCDQNIGEGSSLLVVGTLATESMDPLFDGKGHLIHELTLALIDGLTKSNNLILVKRLALPSWPFEQSYLWIYECNITESGGLESVPAR